MNGLTLITCTGGRPEAFALLEDYIAAQTYKGTLQWIIVDDCDPATEVRKLRPHTLYLELRIHPRWVPGMPPTMLRNLKAGLDHAMMDKILFIEDDEAYLPGYVESMDRMLEETQLAGQVPARYYNVQSRSYREIPNRTHASLCQTGIRRELLTRVKGLCHEGARPFIDLDIWQATGLLSPAADVVSIKGMPGRPGIGIGHRPNRGSWFPDDNLDKLTAWLGTSAAKYAKFYS